MAFCNSKKLRGICSWNSARGSSSDMVFLYSNEVPSEDSCKWHDTSKISLLRRSMDFEKLNSQLTETTATTFGYM